MVRPTGPVRRPSRVRLCRLGCDLGRRLPGARVASLVARSRLVPRPTLAFRRDPRPGDRPKRGRRIDRHRVGMSAGTRRRCRPRVRVAHGPDTFATTHSPVVTLRGRSDRRAGSNTAGGRGRNAACLPGAKRPIVHAATPVPPRATSAPGNDEQARRVYPHIAQPGDHHDDP
jgi:hypothetical protein